MGRATCQANASTAEQAWASLWWVRWRAWRRGIAGRVGRGAGRGRRGALQFRRGMGVDALRLGIQSTAGCPMGALVLATQVMMSCE